MPVKKATRSKTPAAPKKPSAAANASAKTIAPAKRRFGTGAMLVTAMRYTSGPRHTQPGTYKAQVFRPGPYQSADI